MIRRPPRSTPSLHDALPISCAPRSTCRSPASPTSPASRWRRSEEHTSELQSRSDLVCRLLLEKKKIRVYHSNTPNFSITETVYKNEYFQSYITAYRRIYLVFYPKVGF